MTSNTSGADPAQSGRDLLRSFSLFRFGVHPKTQNNKNGWE
jgi:hypothetical protein